MSCSFYFSICYLLFTAHHYRMTAALKPHRLSLSVSLYNISKHNTHKRAQSLINSSFYILPPHKSCPIKFQMSWRTFNIEYSINLNHKNHTALCPLSFYPIKFDIFESTIKWFGNCQQGDNWQSLLLWWYVPTGSFLLANSKWENSILNSVVFHYACAELNSLKTELQWK